MDDSTRAFCYRFSAAEFVAQNEFVLSDIKPELNEATISLS